MIQRAVKKYFTYLFFIIVTCICISAQSQGLTEYVDIARSGDSKKTEKELNKNLNGINSFQTSSFLSSSQPPLVQSHFDKHIPPAIQSTPKPDSLLITNPKSYATEEKANSIVETAGYTTNKLPGITVSNHQHYETNFDADIPPLSLEETRRNIRPAPKEKDLLQSYQRTPNAIGNIPQPFVQDKRKSPAGLTPPASVNKSHRSLPRRACLVHLQEQYHLDHNLLPQPRATKYLVKVRTEIEPGRYMAKLELHCSK